MFSFPIPSILTWVLSQSSVCPKAAALLFVPSEAEMAGNQILEPRWVFSIAAHSLARKQDYISGPKAIGLVWGHSEGRRNQEQSQGTPQEEDQGNTIVQSRYCEYNMFIILGG